MKINFTKSLKGEKVFVSSKIDQKMCPNSNHVQFIMLKLLHKLSDSKLSLILMFLLIGNNCFTKKGLAELGGLYSGYRGGLACHWS